MARPDRKRLVRSGCAVCTNVSVCGWPPRLQEKSMLKLRRSLAVVCPAFSRGTSAAGP